MCFVEWLKKIECNPTKDEMKLINKNLIVLLLFLLSALMITISKIAYETCLPNPNAFHKNTKNMIFSAIYYRT